MNNRRKYPEGIEEYLPVKISKVLIQARVDEDLVRSARRIMKERRYTWEQIFEASLTQLVKEFSHKKFQKCPVCKYSKAFRGPICPACIEAGYETDENGYVRRSRI